MNAALQLSMLVITGHPLGSCVHRILEAAMERAEAGYLHSGPGERETAQRRSRLEKCLRLLERGASDVEVVRRWLWADFAAIDSSDVLLAAVRAAAQREEAALEFNAGRDSTLEESPAGSVVLFGEDTTLHRRLHQLLVTAYPPLHALPPLFALYVLLEDAPRRHRWLYELVERRADAPTGMLQWQPAQWEVLLAHYHSPLLGDPPHTGRPPLAAEGLGVALGYLLAARLRSCSAAAWSTSAFPLENCVAAAEKQLFPHLQPQRVEKGPEWLACETWRALLVALGCNTWGEAMATQYLRATLQSISPSLLPSACSSPLFHCFCVSERDCGSGEGDTGICFLPSFQNLFDTSPPPSENTVERLLPANASGLASSSPAVLVSLALRRPEAQLVLLEQWWSLALTEELVARHEDETSRTRRWTSRGSAGERAEEWELKVTAFFESFRCSRLVGISSLASFSTRQRDAEAPAEKEKPKPPLPLRFNLGRKRPRKESEELVFWSLTAHSSMGPYCPLQLHSESYHGLAEVLALPKGHSSLEQLLSEVQTGVTKSFADELVPLSATGTGPKRLKLFFAKACTAPLHQVTALLQEVKQVASPGVSDLLGGGAHRRVTVEALAAACGAFCAYSVLRWLVFGVQELLCGKNAGALWELQMRVSWCLSGTGEPPSHTATASADELAGVTRWVQIVLQVARAILNAWSDDFHHFLLYRPVIHQALPAVLLALREWLGDGDASSVSQLQDLFAAKVVD